MTGRTIALVMGAALWLPLSAQAADEDPIAASFARDLARGAPSVELADDMLHRANNSALLLRPSQASLV